MRSGRRAVSISNWSRTYPSAVPFPEGNTSHGRKRQAASALWPDLQVGECPFGPGRLRGGRPLAPKAEADFRTPERGWLMWSAVACHRLSPPELGPLATGLGPKSTTRGYSVRFLVDPVAGHPYLPSVRFVESSCMPAGERRSWPLSIGWAVAAMAIVLAVAVGVNLLILGRVMHWDIVTIIGVGGAGRGGAGASLPRPLI